MPLVSPHAVAADEERAARRRRAAPLSVCLVTPDFAGLTRNGGIGTAFSNLARLLADAGHEVTVLYTLGSFTEGPDGAFERCRAEMRARHGIHLVPLPAASGHAETAERVQRWLAGRARFDVIHFPDWLGHGYFLTLARRTRGAFADVVLCVQAHCPSLWHRAYNGDPVDTPAAEDDDRRERAAVAGADLVVSPSRYMLDWYREHGWTLPPRQEVVPNVLLDAPGEDDGPAPDASAVRDIVFFGRLEIRKGLDVFCDALERMDARLLAGRRVTFLGKESLVGDESSGAYLRRRLAACPVPWEIRDGLATLEALAWLGAGERLAVVAARVENSPYVVLEAVAHRLPFIATDAGGTRELIHPADRAAVLFPPGSASLAACLARVLAEGPAPARLAVPLAEAQAAWLALHEELRAPRGGGWTRRVSLGRK